MAVAAGRTQAPDSVDSSQQKRARLVCFRCHGIKIKCDLLQQPGPIYGPCRNCIQAKAPCQLRPSKRGISKRQLQFSHHVFAPGALSTARNGEPEPGLSDTMHMVASGPESLQHSSTSPVCPTDAPLPQSTEARQSISAADASSRLLTSISAPNQAVITSPHAPQVHATPGASSSASQHLRAQASYFSNAGYMQILSHQDVADDDQVQPRQMPADHSDVDNISVALQAGFLETYFEYCFYWCPVIDPEFVQWQTDGIESLLLRHALALCGNRINPPLIQCKDSIAYYNRAKELFYGDCEGNALVRLSAIMLFFWWSTGAPNMVNMDNAWWWTGIAIRIAQESGLHREPQPHQMTRPGETAGLRRRIWWTLFARDRILSISQGRPTVIDPDYCDVKMVTPEDFPEPSNPKVHVFINWVKVLDIGGQISKQLSRRVKERSGIKNFSRDLISWVRSLPDTLSLHIRTARTTAFDRAVHRLYVTYLTNVQLLHMNKSSRLLPKASNAAIIAASCVARIFEDYLARGTIRFLSGEAGWEIAVALLALLHACRIDGLRSHASADMRTLRTALKHIAPYWPSSRMFNSAFDKLLGTDQTSVSMIPTPPVGIAEGDEEEDAEMLDPDDGVADLMDYFPFVTSQTSPLIDAVLAQNQVMPFAGFDWPMDINATLQEFLALPDDHSFDILNL